MSSRHHYDMFKQSGYSLELLDWLLSKVPLQAILVMVEKVVQARPAVQTDPGLSGAV
ncbi:hypothetical protein M422DRAFT_272138 [Sphaerobolus stellatus SS14]|uniref:Uncharacterized protein n=1 Tax=Sphaerobolus stellatus (strain SS14) TaxID=990650 RepID=A0A0C9TC52_SPHS4|nr:hypothetical protein M422DRAFT_272138 [Sphaerobolus stellatus SS14]